MKHFFRIAFMVIAGAAIFLCCGCGLGEGQTAEGLFLGQEGSGGQNAGQPWQYVNTVMGTVVQQTIYAPEETARRFCDEGMALLAKLEQEELSWRQEGSEVARINASAGDKEGYPVSEELAALLADCLELYERSDGAFDVTLGPLTKIWNIDKWAAGKGGEEFRPPSEEEVAWALGLCGSDKIRLVRVGEEPGNFERVEGMRQDGEDAGGKGVLEPAAGNGFRIFMPEGMQLDLGAVGKGLAQSKLLELLGEEAELDGAVISLGGSILTFGGKPDGSPWKVGVINPFDQSANVGILSLEGQWCVSTSGDYERYVEADGVRYHHILDPKTGYPALGEVRGVTVLAKDGLLGDGLSTACFLLGPERGMELAAEYGAEVLFVLADGEIVMSEGMEPYFSAR